MNEVYAMVEAMVDLRPNANKCLLSHNDTDQSVNIYSTKSQ